MKQCLMNDTTDDELAPIIRDACAVVLTPLFDHEKGLRGLTACLARREALYLSMIATTAGVIREIVGTRIAIPDRDWVGADHAKSYQPASTAWPQACRKPGPCPGL